MSGTKGNGRYHTPGYPSTTLQDLIEQSEENYAAKVEEHGPGKNWLHDEARWHIWKACDELFQARNHAHSGRYDRALPNFADALNHMLMAMEIAAEEGVNPDDGLCNRPYCTRERVNSWTCSFHAEADREPHDIDTGRDE